MPAQVVEHLANGVVFHRFSGGDQPVCRLTIHIPGGISELGEATVKVFLNQLTEGTKAMSAEEIAEALDYNGARFAISGPYSFLRYRLGDAHIEGVRNLACAVFDAYRGFIPR